VSKYPCVLRQRTADGMEAKLRAGGWAQKAPEGYLNKERQVKSNKYERWVEMDPKFGPELREAWELLLTGRYTIAGICEELDKRSYLRQKGRPWAWVDSKSGKRNTAVTRLHQILHNPFYAGWVVSERFGIPYGEVRGKWEPLVSTKEYERGLEILRKHDHKKIRKQKRFYLLRDLLWLRETGRDYKLYVSTPTSSSKRSYSYYNTLAKVAGKKVHIPCESVDKRIPDLLAGICVDIKRLPVIKEIYQTQIEQVTQQDREDEIGKLRRRIIELRGEEGRLGRLYISDRISEETYDQLRLEWQEKIQNADRALTTVERETENYIDDLDVALMLMAQISTLYGRLQEQQRTSMLQVLISKLIVNSQGEIVDLDLNSPFTFLHKISESVDSPVYWSKSSKWIQLGALPQKPASWPVFAYGRMAGAIRHKQRSALRRALLL